VSTCISITSLEPKLAHVLEPRASSPAQRLDAIRQLSAAGVPVSVNVAPMIPALNDHEIPAILEAAYAAGASSAAYTVVRLPFSVKEVFADWLEQYFPDRKEKVLGRIREAQGRTLSNPEFGKRISGVGVWAEHIEQVFRVSMIRTGMAERKNQKFDVTTDAFRRPAAGGQLELGLF
jgi:DNA repair photolyase